MNHAKARWRPALARIMMKSTRPGPSSKAGKGRVQIGRPLEDRAQPLHHVHGFAGRRQLRLLCFA